MYLRNNVNVFAGLLPLAISMSEDSESEEFDQEELENLEPFNFERMEDPFKWIEKQEEFAKTLKEIEKDLSNQLTPLPQKKRKKKKNWRKKSPFSRKT